MTAGPSYPSPQSAPRSSFPTGTAPAFSELPDLHVVLDGGRLPGERPGPRRTTQMAAALHARLSRLPGRGERQAASLAHRVVTDELLRAEADRDQNVYLGGLFTRLLSNALPDLVFVPVTPAEVQEALRWARETGTPVTVRGAASAALGGAVPCAGGLTLDLSGLDHIDVDVEADACVVGAGARFRDIHRRLAAHGLALPVYSSNLGGTYAGWLVGGGLGLNSFGGRRAVSIVRAADLVLPSGELVRLHADGRLDVRGEGGRAGHREVPADAAEAWFRGRGLEPFGLADLCGSEGTLGIVVQLVLRVGRRPNVGAFLLEFRHPTDAAAAAATIMAEAGRTLPRPANLKLVLGSHVRHLERIWAEEDARPWRRRPSALSRGDGMPWERVDGPRELRARDVRDEPGDGGGYLYVDFLGVRAGRAFATAVPGLPGRPVVLGAPSVRFARERFKPQQNKRLGPGLLAAELTLGAGEVVPYLRAAGRLARSAGVTLDPEVYYIGADEVLVIAGYLTDHRTAAFLADMALAPALLDLAVTRFGGRPYVLGRWQASFAGERFGEAGLERLRALKAGLDPDDLLSRGVVFGMGLRGPAGRVVERVYRPGVRLLGAVWATPGASALGRLVRRALTRVGGPAKGRGEAAGTAAAAAPGARAIHCVNCGECNSVCPVYNLSRLRLPQTLVHQAERRYGGEAPRPSAETLLGLCMRCGNCEEVCQAGIAHLDVYAAMEDGGSRDRARDATLAAIRGSSAYRDDFLTVRQGMYLRRSPAALTGAVRYHVLRAENEDGPAATCLHCAACVPVCPTGAHTEFVAADARLVTTDDRDCIGCGTCVEVCPGNRKNGGQTLRVIPAPTGPALAALCAPVGREGR